MRVVFAERARRDIGDIYDDIAQHNPSAAQRVEDTIRVRCERRRTSPMPRLRPTSPMSAGFLSSAIPKRSIIESTRSVG